MGHARHDGSENNYLNRILTTVVYDVVEETPLDEAPLLSERMGHRVLLKREDLQPVFSFKIRGAYNKMARLPVAALRHGVIASSAGNHAQGVALSAQRLGCRAVIVMPDTTPKVKVDAVSRRGAEVVLHGETYTEAHAHALQLLGRDRLTFIHPFDDPDVIAGQGTVGLEILRQHPRALHAVFVPIGGGGLISGIASYVKAVRPDIKVIGVQTEDSDAMAQSVSAGRSVTLHSVGLFSDGTAVKTVGEETFRLTRALVDEIVLVNNDALCAAIKDVFSDTRTILEPAGALSVAGMKQYLDRHAGGKEVSNPVVAVCSGANMNFDRWRFVAERAEIGEQREAVFAVAIPEPRGSVRRFCELVGDRNVTEFNYRINSSDLAYVFVGVQISRRAEAADIAQRFQAAGFDTVDLTDDELAKLHLRHLVGGHSPLAVQERLYRFEFPERPGALLRFLSAMRPEWNISLFHYRNHGADFGRVLVGIQVPRGDDARLGEFLQTVGYPYHEETDHPGYRMFLAP